MRRGSSALVIVLVPYKITLLSNTASIKVSTVKVLVPYKITLLSNSNLSSNAATDDTCKHIGQNKPQSFYIIKC